MNLMKTRLRWNSKKYLVLTPQEAGEVEVELAKNHQNVSWIQITKTSKSPTYPISTTPQKTRRSNLSSIKMPLKKQG